MADHDPIETMLSRLDRPVSPSPDFASTLRARVIAEAVAESRSQPDGDQTTMQTLTAFPAAHAGERPDISSKRITKRWMAGLEVAAAVLLLLGTFFALGGAKPVRDRFAGLFPNQQGETSAPLGAAAMYGGDAGRTGQQPGPAPEYEFVDSWTLPVGGVYKMGFAPVALGDTVYRAFSVAPNDDPDGLAPMVLQAVDVKTGTVRWQQELNVWGSPAVTAELVFVNVQLDAFDDQGAVSQLVAVDAGTGEVVWRVETGRSAGWVGGVSPIVIGENVYTATPDGTVFALVGRTGEPLWTSVEATPTATGEESRTGQPPISGSGQLAANDRMLFVVNADGRVNAFDLATGLRVWELDVRDRFQVHPGLVEPMVVKDILVLSIRGQDESSGEKNRGEITVIATVEAMTGENLWQRDFNGMKGDTAVVGGSVIVSTLDPALGERGGALTAIDLSSAEDVWTLSATSSSPTGLSVVGNTIFLSGGDFQVVTIDGETGTQGWMIPIESGVAFPAVVTQQRLIVQDGLGSLLAFSTDQSGSPTAGEPIENAETTAITGEPTATLVPTLVPTSTSTPFPATIVPPSSPTPTPAS